ncbi:Uncharacterised protein [Streptococcus pneumoniae]|nr:Uncharacterised protein [Streptococcus pneumoniae]
MLHTLNDESFSRLIAKYVTIISKLIRVIWEIHIYPKTESCNVSFNSKGLNASSHETSAFIFACSGRLNNKLINIPNKEIHIMFLLLDRTEVAFPLYIIRLKNSTPINSEKLVYKIPRSIIISICGT